MTLAIILAIGLVAILSAPLIALAKREYRGPKVLRWDSNRRRWVATYRRLK